MSKNTYIDISDSSDHEIKLFLFRISNDYVFLMVCKDIVAELATNPLSVVICDDMTCYFEYEKYNKSITISEFYELSNSKK